jgi:hypothetical protein
LLNFYGLVEEAVWKRKGNKIAIFGAWKEQVKDKFPIAQQAIVGEKKNVRTSNEKGVCTMLQNI